MCFSKIHSKNSHNTLKPKKAHKKIFNILFHIDSLPLS